MSDVGDLQVVRLPIRIGDKRIAQPGVPMLVVKANFLDGGASQEHWIARLGEFPGARGALFRSAPLDSEQKRFTLRAGLLRYVPSRYRRHFTPLHGSFADYQARFSSKTRSGLRRKVRKFAEQVGGDTELVVCERPGDVAEFHRMAREISAKTYQERLFDQGLPAGDAFREAMVTAAERGEALGFMLLGGGRPVAYIYCPIRERRLLYQYVGYDPEFAKLSPGTVLQWLAFEYLFEHRPGDVFDFTEGEGDHKAFFGTDSVECADVYFFRPSPRAWLVCAAHALSESANNVAGDVLERVRAKRMVKRLLRR